MVRMQRVTAMIFLTAVAVAACKKKPETSPTPAGPGGNTPGGTTTTPTCPPGSRCFIEREDSIKRERDKERAAAEALAAREKEARATLVQTVYFDLDQWDIRSDTRTSLDAKIPILRANPALRIRVTGHADERGTDEYNLALGQRRANAVKRYLADNGIDPGRLETASLGEEQPVELGEGEEVWSKNRRCEFEIVAGGERIMVPK